MDDILIEDSSFTRQDYAKRSLATGEYDSCTFIQCNFANSDLSHCLFINCLFDNCNLSNTKLGNTTLNDVQFKNCKLLGVKFSDCNPLVISIRFEHCRLDMASFYQLSLKGIVFKKCSLHDVDFSAANLTSACFDDCDLTNAMFGNTTLKLADLRTAYNYSIDPEMNRIHKAKFSVTGLVGLLDKYNITVE